MPKEIKLEARSRTEQGTGAMRRIRRAGRLPGILYGKEVENRLVDVEAHAFEGMLRRHASEQLILNLAVDGEAPLSVMLSEVQRHAATGAIQHLDFRAVSADTVLHVTCPIELRGEPAGVSQQGGVLEHLLHDIEVVCLPSDVVEAIEVDVSALMIGDHLQVGDLPLDRAKYRFTVADNVAVASVAAPRVQEEEAETEEAAAGAAEPEVIGAADKAEGTQDSAS